jgi:hypothetical protein
VPEIRVGDESSETISIRYPEDVSRVRDVFGDRDDVIGFENRTICA